MTPLPTFRQVWFQLHWFFGITAGTLLILIGLSGAVLTFREEIVDAVTPGGRHVPAAHAALPAPALATLLGERFAPRRIATLVLHDAPGHAARVVFQPAPGARRGDTVWVDPSDGTVLPPLRAEPFFAWVERLHRWLLLPREDGKLVGGVLAASLLLLSLSGLYLRWPRKATSWRAWFTFDPALKGRAFLWSLHSVAGTVALVVYLMLTTTGLYWAFDWIRGPIDRAAGSALPARQAMRAEAAGRQSAPAADTPAADIGAAWTTFAQRAQAAGGWAEVNLRLPAAGGNAVTFTWLDHGAPHTRARNRMTVALDGTGIGPDDRHAERSAGQRALTLVYPLHTGTYFGLAGRIVNLLAAAMLPLFAVTGWMLYLDRRRKKRAVALQQAALAASAPPVSALAGAAGAAPPELVLVAHASQTGTAEGIALRSAALLRSAGVPVTVLPLAQVDAERLRHVRRCLLVAATFGEGEAPDGARKAAHALAQLSAASLPQLRYGLLALGDRHYRQFCGFGHTLDHALESAGATRLFPTIEMDDADPAALERWAAALQKTLGGSMAPGSSALLAAAEAPLQEWRLVDREHLNPGSLGDPLFRIDLAPTAHPPATWRAGALAEIAPGPADGDTDAGADTASAARARRAAPPIPTRRYSVASLPAEGRIRLFVRQVRRDGRLGLGSGWLTVHAALGSAVRLRLVDNPAFAPTDDDAPAIFVGNGSGYAGLRAQMQARIAAGRRRNWFVFGERQAARDAFFTEEIAAWQAAGMLEKTTLAFSRDQAERVYVQDRLRAEAAALAQWLGDGACLYVCGSLGGMAPGVDAVLAEVLGQDGLDELIASGRYRRDVY